MSGVINLFPAGGGGSPLISGIIPPTSQTKGKLGQLYWNSTDQTLYVCVYDEAPYNWVIITTGVASPAPAHGKGTEDLAAGTTALESGKAYFVYE